MATAEQIRKAYIDYVLSNNEKPKTVYVFAKKIKITEADFYQFYSSFEVLRKQFGLSLLLKP